MCTIFQNTAKPLIFSGASRPIFPLGFLLFSKILQMFGFGFYRANSEPKLLQPEPTVVETYYTTMACRSMPAPYCP